MPQHVRLGRALALAGVLAIACATLLPAAQAPVTTRLCLICGERGGVDAVLNLLLYAPLGAGLALANVRARQAIPLMTLLSAFIETLQRSVISGRDASVGDLLFNALGGALGFLLLARRDALLHPQPRIAARLVIGWCLAWLGVQSLVSYALAPSWPLSAYIAQLGHAAPALERFPGTVLAARLGTATLRGGRISNALRAREQLLRAAPVVVSVRTAAPTRRTAPVLRIADSAGHGVLLIAQQGTSVLFTARTGADRLRLRPPMLAVPYALATQGTSRNAGVATIVARRADDAMQLAIIRAGTWTVRRVELSTALGWTLVLPAQWRLSGGIAEQLFSVLWVAALLMPLGYWSMRAHAALVASLATLPIGLALVPHAFRLPVATPLEWSAAVAGLVLGGIVSMASVRRATRVATDMAPQAEPVERRPHFAAMPRQESAGA